MVRCCLLRPTQCADSSYRFNIAHAGTRMTAGLGTISPLLQASRRLAFRSASQMVNTSSALSCSLCTLRTNVKQFPTFSEAQQPSSTWHVLPPVFPVILVPRRRRLFPIQTPTKPMKRVCSLTCGLLLMCIHTPTAITRFLDLLSSRARAARVLGTRDRRGKREACRSAELV